MSSAFNSEFADKVAKMYYEKFNDLPKTGKPVAGKNWTSLAGIVKYHFTDGLEIISLATGSKCIGRSEMSLDGDVLNDCHAEVLARRAFIRYLYRHIELVKSGKGSTVLRSINKDGKCSVQENITFHLFTTHVPCGDATIFPKVSNVEKVVKEHFDEADNNREFFPEESSSGRKRKMLEHDTDVVGDMEVKLIKCSDDTDGNRIITGDVNRTGGKCLPDSQFKDQKLPGLDYHVVGVTRTKPGRGDPTLSMTCSDKIAKWNCLGLQGCLLLVFIEEPVYLASIIVAGDRHEYSENALRRAVIDRIKNVPYSVKPVLLHSNEKFLFSRSHNKSASFTSIVWCIIPDGSYHEVYVRGKKLGCTKKNEKKNFPIISKKMFLSYFRSLVNDNRYSCMSYNQIKQSIVDYQSRWTNVKQALCSWSNKPAETLNFT